MTYAIVDREKMVFVAIAKNLDDAVNICWIDYPNTETAMLPIIENKQFSMFSRLELLLLYRNSTGEQGNIFEYGDLVKRLGDYARSLKLDRRSSFDLHTAASKLPRVGKVEPPKKKPVIHRMADTPPEAINQPVASSEKPKDTQASKPSPKGSTGRVWEIADGIYNRVPGKLIDKQMRSEIIEACVAAGIHPATAATQYSKWKGTK